MGGEPDSGFKREREIFFAALEKQTGGGRDAYLQETCGDDVEMLARVQEMLDKHADDKTETFLNPQGMAGAASLPLMEGEDDVVGHYRLVEKLVEGGFGGVWSARN